MAKEVVLMQVSPDLRTRLADNYFKIFDAPTVQALRAQCGGGSLVAPLVFDFDKVGRTPTIARDIRAAGFAGAIVALSAITHPVPGTCDGDEETECSFLALGGDRLIRSPYSLRLVEEVVETMRRRAVTTTATAKTSELLVRELSRGGLLLKLDEARAEASVNQELLVLTASELKIWGRFMRRPDVPIGRAEMLSIIGVSEDADPRTCDSHIKRLRRKMHEASPGSDSVIESIYGVGYRLHS